ncbi:MAG: hypothetical protein HYX43_04660 [Burkholderiales bacterium]|nr:hypothetical protein [Burkholderiales bacterium]
MIYRVALLALLATLAGCDLPSSSKEPTPPHSAREREEAATLSKRQAYELSERCGKTASEEFRREWKNGIVNTETGQMTAGYANHYNSKLNKCFYLLRITHITRKKSDSDEAISNDSNGKHSLNRIWRTRRCARHVDTVESVESVNTSIELWFWEIRDPITGRWRQIRYRMTDDDTRTRFGAEAKKIEWSRDVRTVGPERTYMDSFLKSTLTSANESRGFDQ